MSHFVRCDRCATEDAVMGTVSLPPGWQKICGADLCEPCCMLVRDFIRFTTARAAALPVEPITTDSTGPASDKLFETAPEEKANADKPVLVSGEHTESSPSPDATDHRATSHGTAPNDSVPGSADAPEPALSGVDHAPVPSDAAAECSTEERVRTRAAKRRKKLLGQDAPPDKRTQFPHGANENA